VTMLGVKWSPIAASARDYIDCYETPGWALDALPVDGPVLLHNLDLDFSLAAPNALDDRWRERCATALQVTGSPWFSLHLGFSAELVRFDGHMLPESEPLPRGKCLERFVAVLTSAKALLPVPLLIENLDYCPEGAYEHVCEPEFISEVLKRVDCGLLLDLAHARVSADWLGYDILDYLDRLPLDRTTELHLSSPRPIDGRLDDGHHELTDTDFEILDRVLRTISPEVVILEYTRDAVRLREQLGTLRDVLGRHRSVE
jgi:uncharacterized protein (UPF0276 family)